MTVNDVLQANRRNIHARHSDLKIKQQIASAAGILIDSAEPVYDTCHGAEICEFVIPAENLEGLRTALMSVQESLT